MKIQLLLPLFLLFCSANMRAQQGCQITVKLDGYTYDTLWFGHTFGKREVPEFFCLRQNDGTYLLQSDGPLATGMYAIIYRTGAKNHGSFQCWLAEGQRQFSIDTKTSAPYAGRVSGSAENEVLYRYNKVHKTLEDNLNDAIDRWRYLQNEETFRARVEAEQTLHDFQQDVLEQCPGTLTAALVQQVMFPLPPKTDAPATDWQAEADRRWRWQKQHYFDQMDIATEGFHRYQQWLERTDFYLMKLPPPSPDTTIAVFDEVFRRLETSPEAYQYYNKYMITSLAKMSKFRLDEVFVHAVRNYIGTGKATWPDEDEKRRFIADADRLEQLFDGKKAPEITLFDRQGSPLKLSDVQAPYTLLVYWMPDCSHCIRELPLIAEIYARYKERGLKVLSVCGKSGEQTPLCWDFVDQQNFPSDWHLLADPERKANLASLYFIRTYPRLFILDGEKNIVFKRAGEMEGWQLEAVLAGLAW